MLSDLALYHAARQVLPHQILPHQVLTAAPRLPGGTGESVTTGGNLPPGVPHLAMMPSQNMATSA
jgi:hypothetical protein